jgi:hypothetical protein
VRFARELPAAALVAALLCLAPRAALADARVDLEKAHNAYAAQKYEDAEARLRALLDAKTGELKDPDNIADARMYLAATLLAEKKGDEAATVLEQLLLDRPDYQPDPLRVSLAAADALTDARTRIRDRLKAIQEEKVRLALEAKAKAEAEAKKAALRLAMLEKLASTEVVIERHSRWVGLVPFGTGQFQNGQTAEGWLFLVSEGLLGVGSAVAGGFSFFYSAHGTDVYNQGDRATGASYWKASGYAAITGDVLAGGLLLTAVAGIVHAQATFVPERVETRKREIPALSLSVKPVVGPGGLGIVGTF